jgi:D-amino-acid oxidase
MARDDPDVAVLGGGVIGITTAIHLELAGYETAVYTDHVPFADDGGPTLATTYAAASVYPVYVGMTDLAEAFERSQAVFSLLCESGSMGVRRQEHFVIEEDEPPTAPHADALDGYEAIDAIDRYPRRTGAEAVHGFRFDVLFAETPTYLARCYDLYRALGGVVHRGTLTRDALLSLPAAVLVNCAGLRARTLFDDPRPVQAYVGHQVIARGIDLRDPAGRLFAYSYTGGEEAPPEQTGLAYAYPRMDCLVLGGSRIPTDVEPGQPWDGAIEGPTRTIDGVRVPARLVELNADLLSDYAGVDLAEAALTARYGYRPVRDPDGEGVRIARETVEGRPVVHNYGHGGAGLTLSWVSAARVTQPVRAVTAPDPSPIDVPPEFAVAERLGELVRD